MTALPKTIVIEYDETERATIDAVLEIIKRAGLTEIATTTYTRNRLTASRPNEIIVVPPPTPGALPALPPGSRGVDVSRHQGVIDWPRLANATIDEVNSSGLILARHPVRFAAIRCSMGAPSGSYTGRDDKFPHNWQEASNTALYRLVYHYWRPEEPVETQIANLWGATNGDFGNVSILPPSPDYPFGRWERYTGTGETQQPVPRPVVDVEPRSGETFTEAQKITNTIALKAFLDAIESRLGVKPIIYTSRSAWAAMTTQPAWASEYILWVASYREWPPTLPTSWPAHEWTLWQYSSQGKLPGHESEYIDLNIYSGGWTPSTPPTPTPGAQLWKVLFSASVYQNANNSIRLGYLSVGQFVEESYPAGVERVAGWVRHTGLGADKAGWTLEKQLQKA